MKTQLLFLACAALLAAGCSKDFLNKKNPNSWTTDVYWKSDKDVLQALAATYNKLRNSGTGYWGVRGIELSNGRGDDFFIRNDVKELYQLSTFTNNPDNAVINGLWNGCYQTIFRANQIIQYIDGVPMEEEERGQLRAEARFLRGLNYFILVINFGDVPLRLEVPADSSQYAIEKSPEAEVWKQVEADFSAAADSLPVSYPAEWVGRATQGAALGFLGKSYLFQKKWDKAEATFKRLMQPPFQYDLMPDYADNFRATNENNAESVFEIQIQDVGGPDPWGSGPTESIGVTTAQEFAPAEVSGWFEVYPTDKLLHAFQEEKTTDGELDARLYVSLVWDGEQGDFYQQSISRFFPTEFGFKSRFKKYQNWENKDELKGSKGGNYTSDINERALRFADILLMYAESVTMQGRPQEAYEAMNRIRKRAGLSPLAAGYSQQQMMAEVRHQRMLEFCREGKRFYDLKRWGLLKQEIGNSDKTGRNFFVPGKHDYYPVPQAELDANPRMTQRQGW